jgi:hypothetical protein
MKQPSNIHLLSFILVKIGHEFKNDALLCVMLDFHVLLSYMGAHLIEILCFYCNIMTLHYKY